MSQPPKDTPWNRFKGRKMGERVPASAPVVQQLAPAATIPASGAWAISREASTPAPVSSPAPTTATPTTPSTQAPVVTPAALPSPKRSPMKGSNEVTTAMKNVTISASSPLTRSRPKRIVEVGPIPQTSKIEVLANHFPVTFKKSFPKEIFHYDVVIQTAEGVDCEIKTTDPSTLPDRILPIIWRKFEELHAKQLNAATPFDGKKNCYTAKRLNFDGQDCFSAVLTMQDPDDPDKNRRFRITMKLVSTVPTEAFWKFLRSGASPLQVELPQDVIQALDVALRYAPSTIYTPCNRSFFSQTGAILLTDTLDLWYGHYQSLCLGCDERATLNIDLATKAFYKKMPVKKFLQISLGYGEQDSFDVTAWDENSIAAATEQLKGKLIQYGTGPKTGGNHANYHRFTCQGLRKESSLQFAFQHTKEMKLTIRDYMVKIKNTQVEHPNYPVVHIGSKDKTNYVPLELCSIIPQAYRGKMEASLTSAMIKGAAIAPLERFNRIKAARDGCRLEACKVLKEFGFEVGSKLTEIRTAKRLHAPRIVTKGRGVLDSKTSMHASECKWKYADNQNPRQFEVGAVVPKFAVLVGTKHKYLNPSTIKNFLDDLSRTGEQLGMQGFKEKRSQAAVEQMREVSQSGPQPKFSRECEHILSKMKKDDVKLVIVVIGDDGKEYAAVKAEAEVKVGILTACIKAKNVMQIKPQTIGNYILKLNAKLNGINFHVEELDKLFFTEPIIVIGADVTHPAPNSKAPSIAAVTASFNRSGMGFNMHIQPQPSRQEVIDGVSSIMEKMIKDFANKTGRLPRKLVMFRDGVSEGYFDEIKAKEYEAIKKVCDLLSPDKPIKITFVVVKKRHHTRLQPMNSKDGVGRFCNVPPGTVVDTTIVHPSEQEFFLNSHVGIQGTSKPTRYHVIHDDNKYTMSNMEKLTYFMCYAFVRCTQPVSYPAATYYAHLAAYRARCLIEKDGENADFASLQKQLTIHPDILKNYPMFFI